MEGTFCHSWKNGHHWVDSIFLVHFSVSNNVHAVGRESSTKEGVNQIHLNDNIDKVEYFAEYEVSKVGIMVSAKQKSQSDFVLLANELFEHKP